MQKKNYIDSFPYEVELTARICHENTKIMLESFTDELTIDELVVLDTLIAKPGLSQAELARLILKGKAHTGRFLMSLEEKGFIERHIYEKNGKLIKVSEVTEAGHKLYDELTGKFRPAAEKIQQIFSEEEVQYVIEHLRAFRNAIEKVSKIVFE